MVGEERSEDYLFKVVLLGDCAVGKTALLNRYARNEFTLNTKATIGLDFFVQTSEIDGKQIKAQIWDTASQERFRSMVTIFARGAHGVVLVYDITKRSTYESIQKWREDVTEQVDTSVVTMLVGNKSDLQTQRDVTVEEGMALAERENWFYLETSALDATNVSKAFNTVAKEIFQIVSKKVVSADAPQKEMVGQGLRLTDVEVKGAEKVKTSSCC